MTTKPIASFGVRRSGAYVTVAQEGDRIVVRWRERSKARKAMSFPATQDGKRHAKAHAQGTHERLTAGASPVAVRYTVEELYRRYTVAKAPAWRDTTRRNERARWAYFVHWIGGTTFADLVTPEALDEFAEKLGASGGSRGQPIAPNQIRAILGNVVRVWKWAKRRRLLVENHLHDYATPLGKDARALNVAEFPPEEMAAVVARFSPKDSRRWRGWVALVMAANQGARVNAILQLEDADCDTAARRVTWRQEHDKLGRERVQPLTRDAVHAIRVARVWRRRMGYTGRYLIPAVRGKRRAADLPWVYAALHRLLIEAEREAGVPHRPYRAVHGIRRMVGRNVLEATGGDLNAAAEYLGDTDLRTVKRSYIKERGDSLAKVAAMISTPKGTT